MAWSVNLAYTCKRIYRLFRPTVQDSDSYQCTINRACDGSAYIGERLPPKLRQLPTTFKSPNLMHDGFLLLPVTRCRSILATRGESSLTLGGSGARCQRRNSIQRRSVILAATWHIRVHGRCEWPWSWLLHIVLLSLDQSTKLAPQSRAHAIEVRSEVTLFNC